MFAETSLPPLLISSLFRYIHLLTCLPALYYSRAQAGGWYADHRNAVWSATARLRRVLCCRNLGAGSDRGRNSGSNRPAQAYFHKAALSWGNWQEGQSGPNRQRAGLQHCTVG